MNKVVFASVVAASVFGFASASFAVGGKENLPMKQFGPVVEMMVAGHMMHMQFIEDSTGGQWVVMSREEAEMALGVPLGKYKFEKMNF